MKTVCNRPMIDYLSFLQMIHNITKSKQHPTEREKELLQDVEKEISKIMKHVE